MDKLARDFTDDWDLSRRLTDYYHVRAMCDSVRAMCDAIIGLYKLRRARVHLHKAHSNAGYACACIRGSLRQE